MADAAVPRVDRVWKWVRCGVPMLALLGSASSVTSCYRCCEVLPKGASPDYAPTLFDDMSSPGRRTPDGFAEAWPRYVAACQSAGACPQEPESVGHVAASLRRYPMKVRPLGATGKGWSRHTPCAEEVTELMDKAFSPPLDLDGIEIDAHARFESQPDQCSTVEDQCAFVLHDDLPRTIFDLPNSDGAQYLERNSLVNVLQHFGEHYAAEGRKVYLELKQPVDCWAGGVSPGGACARRIESVVRQAAAVNEQGQLHEGLQFVSFSRAVLETARSEASKTNLDGHVGYYLITGVGAKSNGSACQLVAGMSRPVDRVRDADRDWMTNTEWLTGIWLSPRCYREGVDELVQINLARADAGKPALDIGVSTYQQSEDSLLHWVGQRMKPGPGVPRLQSYIFDIDD